MNEEPQSENAMEAMPPADTIVFAYKGFVGIQGVNVMPKGMGCVEDINKDNFKISQEAYDALHTMPSSRDDMGDVDCFKADDTTVIFGWMGGAFKAFDPKEGVSTASDTDFNLLKEFITEVETPDAFKDLVSQHLEQKKAQA